LKFTVICPAGQLAGQPASGTEPELLDPELVDPVLVDVEVVELELVTELPPPLPSLLATLPHAPSSTRAREASSAAG
jgi:hypothetical protein